MASDKSATTTTDYDDDVGLEAAKDDAGLLDEATAVDSRNVTMITTRTRWECGTRAAARMTLGCSRRRPRRRRLYGK
jgi:hypothetical protein